MYISFPKNLRMVLNQNEDYAHALGQSCNVFVTITLLLGTTVPCIDLFAFQSFHDVVFTASVPNNIYSPYKILLMTSLEGIADNSLFELSHMLITWQCVVQFPLNRIWASIKSELDNKRKDKSLQKIEVDSYPSKNWIILGQFYFSPMRSLMYENWLSFSCIMLGLYKIRWVKRSSTKKNCVRLV